MAGMELTSHFGKPPNEAVQKALEIGLQFKVELMI